MTQVSTQHVLSGDGQVWDPYARGCPSRELLNRIGDKWSVLVIGELADGAPHRYAKLRNRLEGVSEKMLTQTLRRLERDGLLTRTIYPEVPPRVEYALTMLGHTLREPLAALRTWSIDHAADVVAARSRFSERLEPG